jgi:hypothetical protein
VAVRRSGYDDRDPGSRAAGRSESEHSRARLRRALGRDVIGKLEPRYVARVFRAANVVGVSGPEAVPTLALGKVGEQRCTRRFFEWFGWRGTTDESHWSRRAVGGGEAVVTPMLQIEGSGNLENTDSKRNSKVFHNSLSLLWIADVESCR